MKHISHRSVEDASSALHLDAGTHRQGHLQLQTHAVHADIVQIADSPCFAPFIVAPNQFHKIGAEKPLVSAALLRCVHTVLIGNSVPSYDEICS